MPRYNVAEAQQDLSTLLDRALGGDEVVITREGKAVAKLTPLAGSEQPVADLYARMRTSREKGPSLGISSVELLRQMYDEDEPR